MSQLIKKICKRCICECAIQIQDDWDKDWLAWRESDERLWKEGIVLCPFIHWKNILINAVPDSCFYKLEQTVLSEKPK